MENRVEHVAGTQFDSGLPVQSGVLAGRVSVPLTQGAGAQRGWLVSLGSLTQQPFAGQSETTSLAGVDVQTGRTWVRVLYGSQTRQNQVLAEWPVDGGDFVVFGESCVVEALVSRADVAAAAPGPQWQARLVADPVVAPSGKREWTFPPLTLSGAPGPLATEWNVSVPNTGGSLRLLVPPRATRLVFVQGDATLAPELRAEYWGDSSMSGTPLSTEVLKPGVAVAVSAVPPHAKVLQVTQAAGVGSAVVFSAHWVLDL